MMLHLIVLTELHVSLAFHFTSSFAFTCWYYYPTFSNPAKYYPFKKSDYEEAFSASFFLWSDFLNLRSSMKGDDSPPFFLLKLLGIWVKGIP